MGGLWTNSNGYVYSTSNSRLTAISPPATATWSGSVSVSWRDGGNWSTTPSASNSSLFFAAAGTSGTSLFDDLMTPDVYCLANVTFAPAAPAYTIHQGPAGPNGFTLGGALVNSSTNLQSIGEFINLPYGVPNARTFSTTAGGGDIFLGGRLSGPGGVDKEGPGRLTLANSNSYSGPTTINGGTLQIGVGGKSGTLGAGNVVNASVLAFNRSDSYTVNNNISGAGSIYQIGSGTVTLAGANGGLGPIVLSGGALTIAGSTATGATGQIALGASSGNANVLNILPGGTLSDNAGYPSLVAGAASGGSGTINMTGGTLSTASELWLSTVNGAVGTMNMSGGVANIGSWLAVGRGGDGGKLNLSGGSINVAANNLTIASFAGNRGTLSISGGTLHAVNAIYDGEGGTGAMTVSGGVVSATSLFVGKASGGAGTYTQSRGLVTISGTAYDPTNGVGTVVGSLAGSAGTMNISGGTLNGPGPLMVWAGSGSITISQTGSTRTLVNPGWITLGQVSGAFGTLTQTGGSVSTQNDNLYVGWAREPRATSTCTAAQWPSATFAPTSARGISTRTAGMSLRCRPSGSAWASAAPPWPAIRWPAARSAPAAAASTWPKTVGAR